MEKKIGFWKKAWYSITNVKKYDDMSKQGLFSAVKYGMILLIILAIIMVFFETCVQIKTVNKSINYLEDNLPDFTIKNEELSLENEDTIILDKKEVLDLFGCSIVFAQNLEEDEAIKNYSDTVTENYSCLILLKDKYIVITPTYVQNIEDETNKDGLQEGLYNYELEEFLGVSKDEYNKQDVINYLNANISYMFYFVMDFVIYYLTLLILYVFYLIIVSLSYVLVVKVGKIDITIKKAISEVIYAQTLSIILYVIYLIVSYLCGLSSSFVYGFILFIVYIYLILLINEKKSLKRSKIKGSE